jgi:hypothetical protein
MRITSTLERRLVRLTVVAVAFCLPLGLKAQPRTYELPEETVRLLPGPNMETALVCTGCHSADYIRTQPPHRSKEAWTETVTKMRKVFGAPVEDEDAGKIVDYLTATY